MGTRPKLSRIFHNLSVTVASVQGEGTISVAFRNKVGFNFKIIIKSVGNTKRVCVPARAPVCVCVCVCDKNMMYVTAKINHLLLFFYPVFYFNLFIYAF